VVVELPPAEGMEALRVHISEVSGVTLLSDDVCEVEHSIGVVVGSLDGLEEEETYSHLLGLLSEEGGLEL